MPEELERALDKPTPFTKRGVRVLRYANKAKLEATVGFMAAQAKYMELQIAGGTRQPGRAGLKIPAAIQLNQYGNIPRGIIAQLVAVARKEQGMKKATSRKVKVSGKLDLFYGDPPDCLLYTSDAADDLLCVDLGGRRIIKTQICKARMTTLRPSNNNTTNDS